MHKRIGKRRNTKKINVHARTKIINYIHTKKLHKIIFIRTKNCKKKKICPYVVTYLINYITIHMYVHIKVTDKKENKSNSSVKIAFSRFRVPPSRTFGINLTYN